MGEGEKPLRIDSDAKYENGWSVAESIAEIISTDSLKILDTCCVFA